MCTIGNETVASFTVRTRDTVAIIVLCSEFLARSTLCSALISLWRLPSPSPYRHFLSIGAVACPPRHRMCTVCRLRPCVRCRTPPCRSHPLKAWPRRSKPLESQNEMARCPSPLASPLAIPLPLALAGRAVLRRRMDRPEYWGHPRHPSTPPEGGVSRDIYRDRTLQPFRYSAVQHYVWSRPFVRPLFQPLELCLSHPSRSLRRMSWSSQPSS